MGRMIKELSLQFALFVVFLAPTFCIIDETESLARLPTDIIPTKYYLHIISRIHENNFTFIGNVTIDLAVINSTDQIVLHSKLLRDLNATLIDLSANNQYKNVNFSSEKETDFLRIFSPVTLQKNAKYRLEILFTGDLADEDFGFYKDAYKDDNNKTIYIATTCFEAVYARLAFPCFDEPSIKSKFQIIITHGKNFTAISNMPADGVSIPSLDNGMLTTKFLETPFMSTYLIAFIVSNYEHVRDVINGVEYRVFTPPNYKDNGTRSLKDAVRTVELIENYFGIKYPLPKLDIICVDKLVDDGAENWGLITIGKEYFVLNEERENLNKTMYTILLQTHEIVHQWYGNLATPKWWSNLWIKEGFATYFSFILSDVLYPEYRFKDLIIIDADYAFEEGLSKQMSMEVEKGEDILNVYNTESYIFAARVINMFHHAIGDKTFIKGLIIFLSKNQYSAATEDDLYEALQEAIDKDNVKLFQNSTGVGKMMRSWSHNIGYPNITIVRNYDNESITILQDEDPKKRWWIPLSFATASNPNFDRTKADYILPPEHKVTINFKDFNISLSKTDWLIVNKQQTGVFEVVYDNTNLELIAQALNADHTKIHTYNRAQILRDLSHTLDRNDYKSAAIMLPILQYLQFEEETLVWNAGANLIYYIDWHATGSDMHKELQAFVRHIMRNYYRKLFSISFTKLKAIEVIIRYKIIRESCKADFSECLKYVRSLSEEIFFTENDNKEIDENLQYAIICESVKHVSFDEYQKLVAKMSSVNSNTNKFTYFIYSFGCLQSTEKLKFGLQEIFGDSSKFNISTNLKKETFEYAYSLNDLTRPFIRNFLQKNSMILQSNLTTEGLVENQEQIIEKWIKSLDTEEDIIERERFRNQSESIMKEWLRNFHEKENAKNNIFSKNSFLL